MSAEPRANFPITVGDLALMAASIAVVIVAGVVALEALARLAPPRAARLVDPTYAVLVLESLAIVGAVFAFAVRRRGLQWVEIGFRPALAGQIGWAVLAGIACFVVVTPVLAGVNALIDESGVSPQAQYVIGVGGVTWQRVALMLGLGGFLVPISEEIFFRGVIYRWMRERWRTAPSVLCSAVVFGVAHAVLPMVAVGAFFVGIVLAIAYERTGSLWVPITVHSVFNSIGVSVMFVASDSMGMAS